MESVLVSVVIPVYNVEQYLAKCIDSVVSQSYMNLEIILVDDGATDKSGTICDNYALHDTRINVIHKKNAGLGAARNTGMDAAHGKYIIFLDSDDYWNDDTIDYLVYEAEKNNLQVIAFSAEPFFDGVSKKNVNAPSYTHKAYCSVVDYGIDSYWKSKNCDEYYASACLRFCLLDYLRKNTFRFDEGILHEDESWSFFSLSGADKVECINENFYKRRYRANSIMTAKSAEKSSFGYSIALKHMLDAYEQNTATLSFQKALIEQMSLYVYMIVEQAKIAKYQDKSGYDVILKLAADVDPQLKRIRQLKIKLGRGLKYYAFGLMPGMTTTRFFNICGKMKMRLNFHGVRKNNTN